ncbi:MAG: aminodeoxychorismate synthase component I [Acidimicrobiales bacterium]|jgi:para-aminobenzoate synthetase/4-amino-4-deoxychorismate lyase
MTAERSDPARVPFSARAVRVPLDMDKTPSALLRAAGRDARPFALVGSWAGGRALIGSDPLVVVEGSQDPFAVLDEQPMIKKAPPGVTGGGWVGYLGYDLGRMIERLPAPPRRPVPMPSSILAFYDHLVVLDESGQWWFEALWSDDQEERLESRLSTWKRRAGEREAVSGAFECGRFSGVPLADDHLVSVSRAIEHIGSGDVFQVNVCMRLEAEFSGDPIELFCQGAARLEPRYGAFLAHPSSAVASFSPELFLRRQGRKVLSSPIKGTALRQGSSRKARANLLGSDKDRAENLMIVDLVRNDLGRVCSYGTVAVPELYRAEEHPGVWHLVSDVTGELSDGVSDAQLLRATFPPGSVTGAPKVRAMELVSILEATAREVYTGAIGIASPLTGLELNVAIRTFELSAGKVWLGVGGGVVADSDPAAELEECFDKARPLLAAIGSDLEDALGPADKESSPPEAPKPTFPQALCEEGVFETMLVLDGTPIGLESHLGRLRASVLSLYGSQISSRLAGEVVTTAAGHVGPWRLRVHVRPALDSAPVSEISIVAAPEAFSGVPEHTVRLVPAVVHGGLGRHKWHDRQVLSHWRQELRLGLFEQLVLIDEDEVVLETENANVFAVIGGVVRTAPLDGRILPGTTRELVLRLLVAAGLEVSEEPFDLVELASATEGFLTSSVRGLCPVGGLRQARAFDTGPVTRRAAAELWESWRCDAGLTVTRNSQALGARVP